MEKTLIQLHFILKIIQIYLIIAILLIKDKSKKNKIRRPKDIFFPHKIYIESHRGANKEVFQNTIESFKKAIQYKVDSIETDVWLTKDNVLVLVHGIGFFGNISYYYDHPENVIDLDWNELSTYKTKQDNLSMPRLSDLMELAKDRIFLNLEIKDYRSDLVFPHLVKLIEKYDFFYQVSLGSQYFEYYNKILEFNKYHRKKLVFAFIYSRNQIFNLDYTKKGSVLQIHWEDATEEVCKKAHNNGMAIVAWIDILEEENTEIYKQLIKNGADAICCNLPKLAKQFVNDYYNKK